MQEVFHRPYQLSALEVQIASFMQVCALCAFQQFLFLSLPFLQTVVMAHNVRDDNASRCINDLTKRNENFLKHFFMTFLLIISFLTNED